MLEAKIREVYKETNDVLDLSRVGNNDYWRKYSHFLEFAIKKARQYHDDNASINGKEIKKDFRYMLGFIRGLTYSMELPKKAIELINKEENIS